MVSGCYVVQMNAPNCMKNMEKILKHYMKTMKGGIGKVNYKVVVLLKHEIYGFVFLIVKWKREHHIYFIKMQQISSQIKKI